MRRVVILIVPLKVFADLMSEVWLGGAFFREDPIGYRHKALDRLGVCPAAIQACDQWWEDLRLDAVLFRFQTDEDGSTMPEWVEWSEPVLIRYPAVHSGIVGYPPGYRADALNAYFPTKTPDPEQTTRVRPRRLVSLEG